MLVSKVIDVKKSYWGERKNYFQLGAFSGAAAICGLLTTSIYLEDRSKAVEFWLSLMILSSATITSSGLAFMRLIQIIYSLIQGDSPSLENLGGEIDPKNPYARIPKSSGDL